MSENVALLSDGNSSAARRARVKLQPRDKKGRWVPTGAGLFASIAGIGKVRGKAIGGTAEKKGIKNKIRMLVGKGYEDFGIKPNTVLEVDPKNGELDTGVRLNKSFLKRKGINPDLQHSLPKSLADQPEKLKDMNPQPADDLDIELADGGLDEAEDKDFRRERDAEPLAKLPPAMAEQAVEGEEVGDIVEGKPPTLPKAEKPEAGRPPRFPGDKDAPAPTDVSDKPKPPSLTRKDVKDMSIEELAEEMSTPVDPNRPGSLDRFQEVSEAFYRQGGYAALRMKKPLASEPSPFFDVVDEAFGEAFYGGDAPSVEQLVDKAAAKPKAPQAEDVGIADLKPGDVIIAYGNPVKVVSTNQRNGGGWDVMVDDGTGRGPVNVANSKNFPSGLPANAGVKRLKKADAAPAAKPDAKSAPAAKSAPEVKAPAAPKKVAKPAAKPAASKKKASTPKVPTAIPAGRKDNGKNIEPNTADLPTMQKTPIEQLVDENGKPIFGKGRKKIEDPNAIYNALLETNPQAKIDDSGHIVLERADFIDNDGKSYKYEVAVARTHGNQYVERYRFTDENGNTQEFYHFDYKDSFASIYGDKNGVYTFRDQLLGRSMPGKQPPTRDTLNYFGENKTLADRIRYFRGKKTAGSEVTLDDLNKTSFKLLTPQEVVNKYLNGRAEKYNKSGSGKGTKLQSFVGSAWEAIEQDDMPTFEARMLQLLGRLPDSEASRNLLMNTLRDGIKEKFNGTPAGRKLAPLANNLEKKILSEGLDLRDITRRPFSSKDGKTIVNRGDKVRYWNNVGEWSIGEVIAQAEPRKVGNKVYDDIVAVRFGDGQIALLRSNRMDVLGDELDTDLNEHDKDSEPTDYIKNKSGQELRDARGFAFDFGDEQRQDDDNADLQSDQVGSTADQDAAAPYLGQQGVDANAPEATPETEPDAPEGNIKDFEAGDIWPDDDGDRLGTFVEAQIVSAPDGTDAWAVIWVDDQGDEKLEIIPLDSNRVPK